MEAGEANSMRSFRAVRRSPSKDGNAQHHPHRPGIIGYVRPTRSPTSRRFRSCPSASRRARLRTAISGAASVTRRGAVRLRLRFCFHLRKAGVIVRELVEVRPGDLRRHGDIVTGHIRLRITRAVLELDVHPLPELLEIERRSVPVNADPLARGAGLTEGKARVRCHAVNTLPWSFPCWSRRSPAWSYRAQRGHRAKGPAKESNTESSTSPLTHQTVTSLTCVNVESRLLYLVTASDCSYLLLTLGRRTFSHAGDHQLRRLRPDAGQASAHAGHRHGGLRPGATGSVGPFTRGDRTCPASVYAASLVPVRRLRYGRAEFPELLSPSSIVSHATGLRIVSSSRSRARTPCPCAWRRRWCPLCTSSSARPGREGSSCDR